MICLSFYPIVAGFCLAVPVPEALLAPGPEGAGNVEAAAALAKIGGIVPLLEAMDGASPVASNYLRSAVEMLASRPGATVPLTEVGHFLLDRSAPPRGREMAYRLLEARNPGVAAALVPGFLEDPVPALRFLAVEDLVARAAKLEGEGSNTVYLQALGAARDPGQVQMIAKVLEDRGETVDLQRLFGFLTSWQVVAPFDNKGGAGFAAVYPPEEGTGDGWEPLVTEDRFGIVDFNGRYDHLKGVVGYAKTTLQSGGEQEVEFRLGCENAWKMWLNGELLFARDEYHRGMKIDQYVISAKLREGENTVLLKICQNEGTNSWEDPWNFQLRVTNLEGEALQFTP